jgi:hypothetical protein
MRTMRLQHYYESHSLDDLQSTVYTLVSALEIGKVRPQDYVIPPGGLPCDAKPDEIKDPSSRAQYAAALQANELKLQRSHTKAGVSNKARAQIDEMF